MDHLEELTGALIDAAVEAVTAGLDEAAADHHAMRAKGQELRDNAAMVALLGPRLYKLARTILGEVERRSVPRFAAAFAHVRYSKDPPVNELEDARRTLNRALLKTQSSPDAMAMFLLAVATVRVRAITLALGPLCVAVPPRAGRKELRRREIDAADVDPEVADLIIAMTDGGWEAALAQLRALETAPTNRIGIVTSLIALAEDSDGYALLNKIAVRLRRAGFNRAAAGRLEENAPLPPRTPDPIVDERVPHAVDVQPGREARDETPSEPIVAASSVTARFRANPSGKLSPTERLRRSQEAHARTSR
ncbi:hypothetical protein FPZ24_04885 [Sphingomonas panacisoli]|uniref:Uncharacterized protein n=1 Tax=Sphingomonas panacisoli TaxID=1813879 RepID=A0A5B8LGI6_9SPHN|nr:hypothetical protein [Sphingomonas panacisoli]QDZ06895.1 hypothetical protein FPZ24_04885 [Sphingomonas panacisoli]